MIPKKIYKLKNKIKYNNFDKLYLLLIKKASPIIRLSEYEEIILGKKAFYHANSNASKKLVFHNMKLAIKMAHQHQRSWTNLMDLIQEAFTGMMIASKKWNPLKKTRFGTYASYWIKAQLSKFLMTNAKLIHTGNTRSGRKIYFQLPEIKRKLLADGKQTNISTIAKESKEDPNEIALIIARLDNKEISIFTPIYNNTNIMITDKIKTHENSPEKTVTVNQIKLYIKYAIRKFYFIISDNRNKYIWKNYVIRNKPISLVKLGKYFNVSKQRMGQLTERLKKEFKKYLIKKMGFNIKDFL